MRFTSAFVNLQRVNLAINTFETPNISHDLRKYLTVVIYQPSITTHAEWITEVMPLYRPAKEIKYFEFFYNINHVNIPCIIFTNRAPLNA